MNRILKLIKIVDKIDDELGIGMGIVIDENTDVDKYISDFLHKFTVEHDFTEMLSYINESENINKSLLEELNEI